MRHVRISEVTESKFIEVEIKCKGRIRKNKYRKPRSVPRDFCVICLEQKEGSEFTRERVYERIIEEMFVNKFSLQRKNTKKSDKECKLYNSYSY